MPASFARVLDQRRVDALLQHRHALVHEGAEAAAGVEAAAVVDDDRRLAQLPDVVERAGERVVAGLLAEDDLDQRHLVDRREEVDADELRRALRGLREARDRQRRGVAREHRVLRDHGLGLRGDVGLDLAVLEHRLDDEVGAREVVVARRRLDAREDRRPRRPACACRGSRPWRAAAANSPCPSRPARACCRAARRPCRPAPRRRPRPRPSCRRRGCRGGAPATSADRRAGATSLSARPLFTNMRAHQVARHRTRRAACRSTSTRCARPCSIGTCVPS